MTASASPRSASTTSSRTCGSPASGWPTCAATPTTGATSPLGRWPTPTPRPSAASSPSSRSPTRSRSVSPRSVPRADDDQIYRLSYDGTIVDEPGFLVMGGQAESLMSELRDELPARAGRWPTPWRSPCRRWAPAGANGDTAHAAGQPARGRRPRSHPGQPQVQAPRRRRAGGAAAGRDATAAAEPARRRRPTRRRTTPMRGRRTRDAGDSTPDRPGVRHRLGPVKSRTSRSRIERPHTSERVDRLCRQRRCGAQRRRQRWP